MGGANIEEVALNMALQATDDGFEGAVRAALEQVDALKQAMADLAEIKDPLAGFMESLAATKAPLDEALQQLADLRSAIDDLGGAGGIKVDVNATEATEALDALQRQEQATREALQQASTLDVNATQAREQLGGVTRLAEETRAAVDAAMAPVVDDAQALADIQRLVEEARVARDAVDTPMAMNVTDAEALAAMEDVRRQADADREAIQAPLDVTLNDTAAVSLLETLVRQFDAYRAELQKAIDLTIDDKQAMAQLEALNAQYEDDYRRLTEPIVPKVDVTPAEDDLKSLQSAMAGLVTDAATDGADIGDNLAAGIDAGVARAEEALAALRADMGGGTAAGGVVIPGVGTYGGSIEAQAGLPEGYLTSTDTMSGLTAAERASFAGSQMALPGDFEAQIQAEMQRMDAEMAQGLTKAVDAAAAEVPKATAGEGGGTSFFGTGGGAMNLAMNAFMAQQGLQMLMGSAMGTVSLQQLIQQTGMSVPSAEQLMGELGTVGLGPSQAFSTLGQFESSLKSALTVTGAGSIGHEALLAIGAAGQASGLNIGGDSAQAVAQNIVAQLPGLGVQQQLETISRIYQGMVGNNAGMASIQTMFSGLGMGGEQLQNLVANLPQIQQQFQGYTIPGLSTAQEISKSQTSALDMAANMSKLDMEFMALASDAAPAATKALEALATAARPIEAVLGALNDMTTGVESMSRQIAGSSTGMTSALAELRAGFDEVLGTLEGAIGHLPSLLIGQAGPSLIAASQQNLAESAFLQAMLQHFGGNLPAGPLGAPQQVQGLAPNVTVYVQVPASAGKSAVTFAQTTAQEIAKQLRLSGNYDLSS